jgi:hypothetical protein
MKRLSRSFLVVGLIGLCGVGSARADALVAISYDTQAQGTYTVNADGSIRLQTTNAGASSDQKAGAGFFSAASMPGNPAVLGTLGTLTGFSADFLKSLGTTPAANEFAIRLFTSADLTQSLVWENNYNGNTPIAPSSDWQHNDFIAGNFWDHSNNLNYNAGDEALSLTAWETGMVTFNHDGNGPSISNAPVSAATQIYGVQVSYGSGIGAYDGSVRNVELDFGNTQFVGAAVSTPLPPTAIGSIACLGLLAVGRVAMKRKAKLA